MAKRLLRQLGGPGQSWERLTPGEAAILREVVTEVDGIPPFVARLLEAVLSDRGDNRLVMRETGTQTNGRKSLSTATGASPVSCCERCRQ